MMCLIPIHTSHASTVDRNADECIKNPDLEGCNEGEEEQSPSSPLNQSNQQDNPSLVWNIVKLVLALGFVVFLIYALLKFVNKRNQMFGNVRTLQNLGGLSTFSIAPISKQATINTTNITTIRLIIHSVSAVVSIRTEVTKG